MKFPLQAQIPPEVISIGKILKDAGYSAYLVGGCVRDLLRSTKPKDWDITTDALPESLSKIFPHSHYDNTYGTVKIVTANQESESLRIIEVTTFRTESKYSDKRRPDSVSFSSKIEDDLSRRDFTFNALALSVPHETSHSISRQMIIDLYNGIEDLQKNTLKTVGDPHLRFSEDALRLMRAVRLSSELGSVIESTTLHAIEEHAPLLQDIAVERIQAEFNTLILSNNPLYGLEVLRRTGLLQYIIPELLESVGIDQNQAHHFTVWEHLIKALQGTADKKWGLHVRLAALFHDIAKPQTREWSKEKNDWTFYGHDVVGSRVTAKILKRMLYPIEIQEKVAKLVRWHMFFSDTEEISLSAVRRLVKNVGEDLIWDLMDLRVADRIGTGVPKEEPYRLRKFHSMIEEALRSPLSVQMLEIDGNEIIEMFHVKPGPIIGLVLNALMEEVLEDSSLNTKEALVARVTDLLKLSEEELKIIALRGKQKLKDEEEKALQGIRKKHFV